MKTRRIILIAGVSILYIMYFAHIIILCLLRKKMASDENNNTNIAVDVNNNINNDPIRVLLFSSEAIFFLSKHKIII